MWRFCRARCPFGHHVAEMRLMDGGACLAVASRSAAKYPAPKSRLASIRKKRSDFNYLTSGRMTSLQGRQHERNKMVYRKIFHTDVSAIKQHREAVTEFLSTKISLLPVDVVMTAFLGKQTRIERNPTGGPSLMHSRWNRTVRKTRLFHGLSKDRLLVGAFFAYLNSPAFQEFKRTSLTAAERNLLASCRSSWLLHSSFAFRLQRFATGRTPLSEASPRFRFELLHRKDPQVPFAWDHYVPVLPVTRRHLVERGDKENIARLQSEIDTRRYVHPVRRACLAKMYEAFLENHPQGRRAALRELKALDLKYLIDRVREEQRVVAKMMLAFHQTHEAKLFHSGISNFVQTERYRFMIANRGLRPPRSAVVKYYRTFRSLPADARRSYYGIPPRFLQRPTNGFHLYVLHRGLTRGRTKEGMKAAGQEWRRFTGTQRAAFEFAFPISIAPIRPNRAPFHRFMEEQTVVAAPPLGRTGKRPLWFYRQCLAKWRNLSALEKNRYDVVDEVKAMFPLVVA